MDKTKILMTNGSLMKFESIAECSRRSILQYFWPALSDNWYWKPIFGVLFEWPLKTGFTVFVFIEEAKEQARLKQKKDEEDHLKKQQEQQRQHSPFQSQQQQQQRQQSPFQSQQQQSQHNPFQSEPFQQQFHTGK